MSRVTSTGTMVAIVVDPVEEWPVVTLHNPQNGPDVAPLEVGRVIHGGLQAQPLTALLFPFVMSPETLRAIADVVEEWEA